MKIANLNISDAANLNVKIVLMDQYNVVNPSSLLYYWSSTQTPNQQRALNIMLSLLIPPSTVPVQLSQAAQVVFK